MKLKIKEESVHVDDLKRLLKAHFADTYTVKTRSKNLLAVAQSKTIGATVLVQKKAIIVTGNFPTMASQMVFTILLFLLGIIPPLIVYFLVFHKKMKVVEKDVADFINSKYKDYIIT